MSALGRAEQIASDWRLGWVLFACGGAAGGALAVTLGLDADEVRRLTLSGAFTFLFLDLAARDIRTMRLPQALTHPGIVLALLSAPLWPERELWSGPLAAAIVAALVIGPYLLWRFEFFALGDVKMSIMAAAVVGLADLPAFITLTVASGGIAALLLLMLRRATRETEYAYGPFLALGGTVALWL